MQQLGVSDETADRAVQLQELLNMGTDTLVGLALDVFALMVEAFTGKVAASDVIATHDDVAAAIALTSEHGWSYHHVRYGSGRASRQRAQLEARS